MLNINNFSVRRSTFERLALLSGGGLSYALEELLKTDPFGSSILDQKRLKSVDRRVAIVLSLIHYCFDKKNGSWQGLLV